MIPYPHFDPVALAIGPLKVRWYGLMYVMGFLAAWQLAKRRSLTAVPPWTELDIDDFLFFTVFGVILGGRLGYLLFYGQQALAEDPSYWYRIWEGGMSFHGGLIGVLTALVIYAWRRRRHWLDVFDFAAPLPGIGIFCGRMGNFINGELWGKPTDLPIGFLVQTPDGQTLALHASQLYEGMLEGLVLFVILWWFSSKPRPRGAAAGLFLVVYAVARILVEFVRVPDVQLGYLAGDWLTMGMLLSLPMLLAGAGLMVWAYRHKDRSVEGL
jgi:phosphatidylglycerol:prolipoprotein diacylglycerol transferase